MAAALFGFPSMVDQEANEVVLDRIKGAIAEVWQCSHDDSAIERTPYVRNH